MKEELRPAKCQPAEGLLQNLEGAFDYISRNRKVVLYAVHTANSSVLRRKLGRTPTRRGQTADRIVYFKDGTLKITTAEFGGLNPRTSSGNE